MHSSTAPAPAILRIPVEILGIILKEVVARPNGYVIPSKQANGPHIRFVSIMPDLHVLAQVCKHFHAIVLETPNVWNHVMFLPADWPRAMQTVLSRSKDCPLYLILRDTDFDFQQGMLDSFGMCPIFPVIQDHYSRLHNLEVSSQSPAVIDCFLTNFREIYMPQLRDLRIYYRRGRYGPSPVTFENNIFQKGAPNLTSISLERIDITLCNPSFHALKRFKSLFTPINLGRVRELSTIASCLTTLDIALETLEPPDEIFTIALHSLAHL